MRTTRASLLQRVRDPEDRDAWLEFYEIYAPLLYRFARGRGLSPSDAEEVRDQCLEVLSRRMPEFDYDRTRGRFKGWLFTMAQARVVDLVRLRRASRLSTDEMRSVADARTDPRQLWEEAWRREHLRFAMDRARLRVSALTWNIFELLLQDVAVPDVCRDLGVNRNQVYKARGRVLTEVRALVAELESE